MSAVRLQTDALHSVSILVGQAPLALNNVAGADRIGGMQMAQTASTEFTG